MHQFIDSEVRSKNTDENVKKNIKEVYVTCHNPVDPAERHED